MKAIILCAGYATRLYPLTKDRPKALLPVKEKPILDYALEKIPKEIEKIIVSNNKFYNDFLKWSESHDNIKVLNDMTVDNESRLGGIGDLWFAIEKEKIDDDLLVLCGDNLFDFDLRKMIDFFKKNEKTVVAVSKLDRDEIKKMGVIESDESNKIISFEEKPEKPKSNTASTGIYIFSRNDLNKIKEYMSTDRSKDGPGFLIKYLYPKQDVYSYSFEGRWFDIGSKETYKEVNEIW